MPAPAFDEALSRLIGHEGGFVDHPADPGGATNWGITERVARANGYTGAMRAMPRSVAAQIYRRQYWAAVRADDLPREIAFQVFDAAVNHGPTQAVRWLQAAVGTTQDGLIGPKTLQAAALSNRYTLPLLYNAQRLNFYTGLSTWPTFGRGWARRVAGNLTYAAKDLQ